VCYLATAQRSIYAAASRAVCNASSSARSSSASRKESAALSWLLNCSHGVKPLRFRCSLRTCASESLTVRRSGFSASLRQIHGGRYAALSAAQIGCG
jgi:hypothetical protein